MFGGYLFNWVFGKIWNYIDKFSAIRPILIIVNGQIGIEQIMKPSGHTGG